MKKYSLLLLAFLLNAPLHAHTQSCLVTSVSDGDTIHCLTSDKQNLKIRLNNIDAPETTQDFGQKAKEALSDLIYKKQIELESHGKDQYQRTLGVLYLTQPCNSPFQKTCKKNINLQMVKQGMAWVYRYYSKDPEYLQAEAEARKDKIGLWSHPNPTPPWEYRRNKKKQPQKNTKPSENAAQLTSAAPSSHPLCQKRKTCRQIKSCAEALFYLQYCHFKHLDNDQNGIPCENLCNSKQALIFRL